MPVIYDSAWVPAASGAINAAVPMGYCSRVRIVAAASGSGGGALTISFAAGLDTPTQYQVAPYNATPAYPTTPKITGSYLIGSPPAANDWHAYYIGQNLSGALTVSTGSSANPNAYLDAFVPDQLFVSLAVSASSWGRVIVEGS